MNVSQVWPGVLLSASRQVLNTQVLYKGYLESCLGGEGTDASF